MTRYDTWENNYGFSKFISLSISDIHKFNLVTILLPSATTETLALVSILLNFTIYLMIMFENYQMATTTTTIWQINLSIFNFFLLSFLPSKNYLPERIHPSALTHPQFELSLCCLYLLFAFFVPRWTRWHLQAWNHGNGKSGCQCNKPNSGNNKLGIARN